MTACATGLPRGAWGTTLAHAGLGLFVVLGAGINNQVGLRDRTAWSATHLRPSIVPEEGRPPSARAAAVNNMGKAVGVELMTRFGAAGGIETVCGAALILGEMMRRGILTHLATNGATTIEPFDLTSGYQAVDTDDLARELVRMVRDEVGAVAAFKEVRVVEKLPKTRSGKIMRRLLKDIAEGKELGDVTTLANADIVDDIKGRSQ